MHTHTPGVEIKRPKSSDCGCGGGDRCGCEARCCDLECLVRPNFFCGQLLTDGDLAATVEWARSRFSLSRYRDGWGVVCGLDVTCSSPRGRDNSCDEKRGPTVYVNPGYAVDCCGNDLVVCEPLAVNLTEICKPQEDPCERPMKPKGQNGRLESEGKREGDRTLDCWRMLSTDLVAVDLFLRYHEDLAQPQRPLLRSGCADVAGCEYTRVLEQPCVHVEIGSLDRKCEADDASAWQQEFDAKSDRTRKIIDDTMGLGLHAVLKHLRKHPPFKFCFLEDLVCCLIETPERNKANEADLRRVAFWLYLDWLLHVLECPCPSCRPDKGVPIARVILRRTESKSAESCRVVLVDATEPYRRPLRRDECRPIFREKIDLAPYLWQPQSVAIDRLGALGLQVVADPNREVDTHDLYAQFGATVLLQADIRQRLRTLSIADPLDCRRVVGFELVP